MKLAIALVTVSVLSIFAAEDSWKSLQIKSGTEVRVYKRATSSPVVGKLDEVRPEALILVVKDTLTSIAKDDINRIDARPEQTGPRVKRESKTEMKTSNPGPGTPGLNQGSGAPEGHSSSTLTFGGKPDFETVYRRTPASAPMKGNDNK